MALSEKDISLMECLQANRLTRLPSVWNPENDVQLLKGIALVRKHGGSESYVNIASDGKGGLKVTRDFGKSSAIIKFIEYYALDVLDQRKIVKCRTRDEYTSFLTANGYDEKEIVALLDKKDYATLDSYVKEASLKIADKSNAEQKRLDDIRDFAEKVRKTKKTSKSRISYGKK